VAADAEGEAMRRWILAVLVLLMAVGGAAADTWQSDSDITNGLVDVGTCSTPAAFQMDSIWYLIVGECSGEDYFVFTGFNWTGTAWQSDSAIVSDLIGTGAGNDAPTPTVFQKDGTWYLIVGGQLGGFTGFNWTGTAWQSDSAIVSGLGVVVSDRSSPTVFQKDTIWYLISGEDTGDFTGFNWTGTAWQSDSAMASGLAVGSEGSNPTVFQKDGTWYLITGEYDGIFTGFNWTGTAWQSDSAMASGLVDIGMRSYPTVFKIDGQEYLISGEMFGDFYGFNMTAPSYAPVNLDHSMGIFWVNHTWEHGAAIADSYNVSVNDTWYNDTTNTFFNNTLSAFNQWSNITVYGYNTASGLSVDYVTEDVELVAVPPTPIGTGSTWDFFWVNHTWMSGTGYVTDSYNISVNDVWHNSTDEYYNNTLLSDWGDWSNITVYAFNSTGAMSVAYIYQDVQIPYPIPPTPIGLDNTWDFFWVNHTWTSGTGYVTDSYNISVNDVWHNSTDEYYNNTLSECWDWSNITVYAFNNSGGINETSVSQDVRLPCFVPPTPTGLDSTQGLFWINHTWTNGVGYVTDSYNVSINNTWYNGTTNEYYNNVLSDYGDWSNITVYAFNDTFGRISETNISQNVQIPCESTYFDYFESYSIGELAGQEDWSIDGCGGISVYDAGTYKYIGGRYNYSSACQPHYKKESTAACPLITISGDRVYAYFNLNLEEDGFIKVGFTDGSNVFGGGIITSGFGDGKVQVYTWEWEYTSAIVEYDNTQWTTYEIIYDFVNDEYVTFKTTNPNFEASNIPKTYAPITSFDECLIEITASIGYLNLIDDIILSDTPLTPPLHEYVLLKDVYGNYIENCEVSIYSTTYNEYVQKWTLLSDGILEIVGADSDDYMIMVRTFDGVFTKSITLDTAGSGIHNFTIPLNYNINVVPVDEYDKPLHNVFVGLFEYAIADPQAWWGYDTFWGHVPVTNCSGFSRCDIIAEKGGYVPYEVTGLNWTSRSAMVKDYRHEIVMVKE
jgi:hypothetical protein